MRIITLLNEKGGVGKTTLATHLAAGLAIRGLRVVLADADPQGHVATALNLRKEAGLYNALIRQDEFEMEDVLRHVNPDVYAADGARGELYVLPGNIETRAIMTINPNPYIIRERFADLDGWADVVVFDTSPTPSVIHTAVYMATDAVLMPTNCAMLSLDGLAQSILHQSQAQKQREADNMGEIRTLGIVPTMYRSQTTAHDVALQQLLKEFRQLVWPPMPLRTVWEQASLAGELLFKYAPQDPTVAEAWALIDRVEQGILTGSAV